MSAPFLQSYILPVVTFSLTSGAATIKRLFGTAFVIESAGMPNSGSLLMTAKHVLAGAINAADADGAIVGVIGKDNFGASPDSIAAPLLIGEGAPNGSDIAICYSKYRSETFLHLAQEPSGHCADVATLGYPDEAKSGDVRDLNLNLRAQKGYIQRPFAAGDLVHYPRMNGYELSFMLAGGMSGAPIFQNHKARDLVIGVAVGTFGAEVPISERTEVQEGNTTYRELRYGINKYGIAESIHPILDWKPGMLHGVSLSEFVKGTKPNVQQVFVQPGPFKATNMH